MKSWMGGRRRRITVARRDPMILQRQYFARRREQNQQNAHRAQVRHTIDSFRRPEPRPGDNNRDRRALEQPLPVSTDFLLLANPSAIDAVAANLRLPKRPRLEGPRRGKHERAENLRREPVEALDVSNDIRIFDADVEKTQQFRRRILPDDFLNSQVTMEDRRQGRRQGRRGAKGRSRNAILGTRPSFQRDRRNDETRIVRRKRDSSPPLIRMDQVIDMGNASQRIAAMPDRVYRGDVGSRERTPPVTSNRFRSPTSSPLDERAVTRRFEEDEFVEATPSDGEPRDVYKDFLLGVSPNMQSTANSRIPTAQKLLSTLSAISPHFPPVKIESDSSESLTQYRPKKTEEKYKFRSLLSKEDITSEQFSADLQELEHKLLNVPDRDVPFLSVSRALSDRKKCRASLLRNAFSSGSKFNTLKESTTKVIVPTFIPVVTNVKLKESFGILPRPAQADKVEVDKAKSDEKTVDNEANIIPKSRNASMIGMEVSLGSDARNPVTLAADGAVSEIHGKGGPQGTHRTA